MAARLSFDSAYRSLRRGELAPVYYLTGSEDLLKDELVEVLVNRAVDAASRDFNLDVRSAGDVSGEAFHALVETPPMLAERRLVVIRNVEQWRKNAKVWQVVHRYLSNPSPTTVLVLLHGADQKPLRELQNAAVHVTVDPLSPDRLMRWAKVRAERAGCVLSRDATDHLLRAVGSDLAALATEIEKLASAAPESGELDATAVADLVGVRRGETLFDWVDAALERDTVRAVAMTETVLAGAGVTAVRLVSALGTALLGLRLTRALLDDGASPRKIEGDVVQVLRTNRPWGLRDWRDEAARWSQAASQWSTAEVRDALRAVYQSDVALKSTTVTDETGILSNLLLGMTRMDVAA
jgi:DNA polymerase-3 subunit delta